jgi:hypothetical protein
VFFRLIACIGRFKFEPRLVFASRLLLLYNCTDSCDVNFSYALISVYEFPVRYSMVGYRLHPLVYIIYHVVLSAIFLTVYEKWQPK